MSNVEMTPETEEYIQAIRKMADALGKESRDSFEQALNWVCQRDSFFGKPAKVFVMPEMFSETDLYWVLKIQKADGSLETAMNGGVNFSRHDNMWSVNT